MWRFGLNLYLELIYQLLKSHIFVISAPILGPLGPKKTSLVWLYKHVVGMFGWSLGLLRVSLRLIFYRIAL